jgi:hypothetical protein
VILWVIEPNFEDPLFDSDKKPIADDAFRDLSSKGYNKVLSKFGSDKSAELTPPPLIYFFNNR